MSEANLEDDYEHSESECFVSFEDTKKSLTELEQRLAARENIADNIRETLLERVKNNSLGEDELVSDWLEQYSTYVAWIRMEASDLLSLILEDVPSLRGLSTEELEDVSDWAALCHLAAADNKVDLRPAPDCLRRLLPRNHWVHTWCLKNL